MYGLTHTMSSRKQTPVQACQDLPNHFKLQLSHAGPPETSTTKAALVHKPGSTKISAWACEVGVSIRGPITDDGPADEDTESFLERLWW